METSLLSKNECQQCSDPIGEHDSKPTYTSEGEIAGWICDGCRLKNVEYARRCQLTACKTKSEGKTTGFRMLPTKFYSLREGDVKRRLIKQFGITADTKACCNVCYLGMSKAITQLKIVYGEEVVQKDSAKPNTTVMAGRNVQSGGSGQHTNSGNEGGSSSNEGYQGPQFKWGSNTPPQFWKQIAETKSTAAALTNTEVVARDSAGMRTVVERHVSSPAGVSSPVINQAEQSRPISSLVDNKGQHQPSILHNEAGTMTTDQPLLNTSIGNMPSVVQELKPAEGTVEPGADQGPTPKTDIVKMEQLDRFDDDEMDDDDISESDYAKIDQLSPSKRQKRKKEDLDFVSFDYFVSCIGCQKICSFKEAKAAYDYEQGYIGRLCNDCRMKRREENKHCSILGCDTPAIDVVLRSLPPSMNLIKGRLKGKVCSMFGIGKNTKLCCKQCWKKITAVIKPKLHAAAIKKAKATMSANGSPDDASFTVCLACHRIVKSTETYCRTVDGIPDPKVLCHNCLSEEDRTNGTYVRADGKSLKAAIRTPGRLQPNGICQVRNCVSSGTLTVLVSCERLIRRSGDESKVREKFNLDPNNNLCCRSCLQRVKWYMIELLKANHQYDALPRRGKPRTPLKKGKDGQPVENCDLDAFASPSMVPVRSIERPAISGLSSGGTPATNSISTSTQHQAGHETPLRPAGHATVHQEAILHHPMPHRQRLIPASSTFMPPGGAVKTEAGNIQSLFAGNFPMTAAPQSASGTNHPPVIQVGGQQLILSVIHRCDKETQTGVHGERASGDVKKRMPYVELSESDKMVVRQSAEGRVHELMAFLNDVSGGHGRKLLVELSFQKESTMASSYRKLLTSIGEQYRKLDEDNQAERLRLLSLVALQSSSSILKVFFHRISNEKALSVSDLEIAQAREYAKQFGPGVNISGSENIEELIAKTNNMIDTSGNWDTQTASPSPAFDDTDPMYMEQDELLHDMPVVLPRDIKEEHSQRSILESNSADAVHQSTDLPPQQRIPAIIGPRDDNGVLLAQHTTLHQPTQPLASQIHGNDDASLADLMGAYKAKRTRTHFTRGERDLLEVYFQKSPYMSKAMFAEIRLHVDLDKKKVDTWFRNRRSKQKKDEYDVKLREALSYEASIHPRPPAAVPEIDESYDETDDDASVSDDGAVVKDGKTGPDVTSTVNGKTSAAVPAVEQSGMTSIGHGTNEVHSTENVNDRVIAMTQCQPLKTSDQTEREIAPVSIIVGSEAMPVLPIQSETHDISTEMAVAPVLGTPSSVTDYSAHTTNPNDTAVTQLTLDNALSS